MKIKVFRIKRTACVLGVTCVDHPQGIYVIGRGFEITCGLEFHRKTGQSLNLNETGYFKLVRVRRPKHG